MCEALAGKKHCQGAAISPGFVIRFSSGILKTVKLRFSLGLATLSVTIHDGTAPCAQRGDTLRKSLAAATSASIGNRKDQSLASQ